MGYLCLQVVGLLIAVAAATQQTTIHLFPAGVVSEETIKTNLHNAYNRFFRARQGKRLSFYLDNVLIIDHVQLPSTSVADQIDKLNLKRERNSDCVPWYMDQLEGGADNYILTDLNPCNGTLVVKQARQFLQKNRKASITLIGMGNSIHSEWLKQTCGPCHAAVGCVRNWNWFRI